MISSTYRCRTRASASAEASALVRERPQRLGGDGEGIGEHRQLPAPRGDDLTLDADVVTEINVLLPGGQRVGAHPVQRDHDLQVAGAVPDRREAELPAVAVKHHPPGHPDPVAGRGVGRQVRMAGPHLRDRRGAGKADGIGVKARRPHPLQLREAHLHLLGHVAAGSLRRVVRCPVVRSPVVRSPVVRRSAVRRSAALLIVGHLPEITGARRAAARWLSAGPGRTVAPVPRRSRAPARKHRTGEAPGRAAAGGALRRRCCARRRAAGRSASATARTRRSRRPRR